jgi:cytochrome oxidase Cu insertion factor (SCO1/SenC/PrrC family)
VRPRRSDCRFRARLAAAACLCLLAATACSGGGTRAGAPPTVGTAGTRVVPPEIAGLSLLDDTGAPTTLASLHGKIVVLTDFLTLCQEICPLVSANLSKVQDAVARAGLSNDIELVEVTVDTDRDTPARLAAYGDIVGAQSNWKLLTGSAANVAALWKWFGVAYEKTSEQSTAPDWWTGEPLTFDVGHTDAIFFLDRNGTQRYVVAGPPNASGVQIPAALSSFLNDEGRTNVTSAAADSWTAADVDAVLSWLTGRQIAAR